MAAAQHRPHALFDLHDVLNTILSSAKNTGTLASTNKVPTPFESYTIRQGGRLF